MALGRTVPPRGGTALEQPTPRRGGTQLELWVGCGRRGSVPHGADRSRPVWSADCRLVAHAGTRRAALYLSSPTPVAGWNIGEPSAPPGEAQQEREPSPPAEEAQKGKDRPQGTPQVQGAGSNCGSAAVVWKVCCMELPVSVSFAAEHSELCWFASTVGCRGICAGYAVVLS